MKLSGELFLLIVLLAVSQFRAADAQFFTKSSKSIPRMGRRSVQEPFPPSASGLSYGRALVDRLVDEYGPNLLEVLQARAAIENSREFALRNDQPIDGADFVYQDNNSVQDIDGGGTNMPRNERTPSSLQVQNNQRDASLAMRALNANRLLQALSSGQPLMSYDKMYSSQPPDRQDNVATGRQAKFAGDK